MPKHTFVGVLVGAALAMPLGAQAAGKKKVDFEKQVLPILTQHCTECHSAAHVDAGGRMLQPKGKVEVDSVEGIHRSKRGKLIVANKPDDSLLLDAISLPADDEDRMPPPKKGPPLSKEQIELIAQWIEDGADFGKWTGAAARPAASDGKAADGKDDKGKGPKAGDAGTRKKPPAESPLIALQKNLHPLAPAVLTPLAQTPFQVHSVGDDSPLLTVTCCGRTDEVDDRAIALLAPLAEHITELDLARTQVTDAACEQLAKLTRLTKLDLRQTQVGNQGIAALAACKELRSLNLFGTKTGDYALAALAKLPHLEQLYLWQTDASAPAVVRLRETIPGLRIVFSADLPEPMTDQPAGGRRKR